MDQTLAGVIDLNPGKSAPLTRQLYDQLRLAIADGRLRQGYRLPSSRMLAGQLAVSRNTVSAAVDQLVAEGYLDIARGRRPSIAAGLVRPPIADAARRRAVGRVAAPPRLSSWARRIGQSNWPLQYEGAPRPFTPGLADHRAFPHDIWARCLRRAARDARRQGRTGHNRPALQEALARPSSSTAASGRSRARSSSRPRPRRRSS